MLNWFRKKPTIPKNPPDRVQQPKQIVKVETPIKTKEELVREEILNLVKEEEEKALLKKDEFLLAFQQEYEKDKAGFEFKCERWGAFLTLFIARRANKDRTGYFYFEDYMIGPGLTEYSTSINIKNSDAITLHKGHPPDCKGTLWYSLLVRSDDMKSLTSYYGKGEYRPPQGYHHEISPIYPTLNRSYNTFRIIPAPKDQPERHGGWHHGNNGFDFKTENYPQSAKDDEIYFTGIRATLFVPHGFGEEVLSKILLATEGLQ